MKPEFNIEKGKVYKFTLIDKSKPSGRQKKNLYFFAPRWIPVPLDFLKTSGVLEDPSQDISEFLKSSGLIQITIDDLITETVEVTKRTDIDTLIKRGILELNNQLWK
jgi:hypothetical protein